METWKLPKTLNLSSPFLPFFFFFFFSSFDSSVFPFLRNMSRRKAVDYVDHFPEEDGTGSTGGGHVLGLGTRRRHRSPVGGDLPRMVHSAARFLRPGTSLSRWVVGIMVLLLVSTATFARVALMSGGLNELEYPSGGGRTDFLTQPPVADTTEIWRQRTSDNYYKCINGSNNEKSKSPRTRLNLCKFQVQQFAEFLIALHCCRKWYGHEWLYSCSCKRRTKSNEDWGMLQIQYTYLVHASFYFSFRYISHIYKGVTENKDHK